MIEKSKRVHTSNTKPRELHRRENASWSKWMEHWETWNAIVAEVKPPQCGMFGCDEKVKVRGKWKCVACGKITDTAV